LPSGWNRHGIIERARSLLPGSREAADLRLFAPQPTTNWTAFKTMTSERRALEEERKKLRTEWGRTAAEAHQGTEAQFAEMQKRFDENVARVVEAVKERELRAQLEKTSRRKMQTRAGRLVKN